MKPLLYLAPVAWHGLWQRPQRLAVGLSERFALTYVNPVGLRSARWSDCKRLVVRGQRRSLAAPLPIWRPRYLPWRNTACDALNRRWLSAQARSGPANAIPDGYVLWIGAPSVLALTLLETTRPGLVIYDCMDHFADFHSGRVRDAIDEAESEILAQADLVLATSRPLFEEMSSRHRRVTFAPNGVDFEHFAGIERPRGQGTPRPVIGFHGTLGDWVNYELIRELALARPDWRWEFLGPVQSQRGRLLAGVPSVSIRPPVPFAELHRQLAAFDVGIIPFVRNRLTEAAQPVKFWEYLAAGLPVISAHLASLNEFSDYAALVDTPQDWLAALDAALAPAATNPQRVAARRSLAASHAWTGTLDIVLAALAKLGETSPQHVFRTPRRSAA